ncbi:MAG TPA: ArsA family ATPase [Desulfosalsimonadaceae bacterium]|nr:ArsA family ATPase [Desulfosalsimonadaceae bacterium]
MKSIFFTGKGGTGKSTLSASAALQISERGKKVLLVSFDPAHNLGDIFHLELGHKKYSYTSNLYLQETDLEEAAREYLHSHLALLNEAYSYMKAFNLEKYFQVFQYSPGVEEYAALICLEKILNRENAFDFIVFDTPPTGLTLRILALPAITCAWLQHLIGLRRDILKKRYTIHNITGKYDPEGVELVYREDQDRVMQKILEMQQRYERVKRWLEGGDNMIAVVLNPDFLSLRESRRLMDGLQDLALKPAAALHNKVDPANLQAADEIEQALLGPDFALKLQRVYSTDLQAGQSCLVRRDLSQIFL